MATKQKKRSPGKTCPEGCVPASSQPAEIVQRSYSDLGSMQYKMSGLGKGRAPKNVPDTPPEGLQMVYEDPNGKTVTRTYKFDYTQPDPPASMCRGEYLTKRLESGTCGAQLVFREGQAFVRVCAAPGKVSKMIRASTPDEAVVGTSAACASRKRSKPRARPKAKTAGVRGASSGCPYGKYKSGPRKGQCRVAPVRGSGNKARRAR